MMGFRFLEAIFLLVIRICFVIAQDISSILAYESAYRLYIEGIVNNPTFIEAVEFAATDPAFATIPDIVPALLVPATLTGPPAYYTDLPASLQPFFSSVYTQETMLAEEFGVSAGEPFASVGVTVAVSNLPTTFTTAVITPFASPVSSEFSISSLPSGSGNLGALTSPTDSTSLQATTPSTSSSSSSTSLSSDVSSSMGFAKSSAAFSLPPAGFSSEPVLLSSTISAGAAGRASASATSAASNNNSHETSLGNLPAPSLIGIGIGVGLAVVLIILFAFMVIRLFRKTKQLRAKIEAERGREPGIAVTYSGLGSKTVMMEPGVAVTDTRIR